MMQISKNIRRYRKIKNLSQKEVALSVGIAQGQYSLIENGKVIPTIPTLEKIAEVFEISLSEIVKDGDQNNEEINLSLLEKIKLIDRLDDKEKKSIMTIIDMAIAKKQLKDDLGRLIA